MHALVRTVFTRLHALDAVEEERKLAESNHDEENDMRLSVSATAAADAGAKEPPESNVESTPQPEQATQGSPVHTTHPQCLYQFF